MISRGQDALGIVLVARSGFEIALDAPKHDISASVNAHFADAAVF
jgi:hypothetical protein